MTFNTEEEFTEEIINSYFVLNLVINGWPSIHLEKYSKSWMRHVVLNLVINGWPSIPKGVVPGILPLSWGFKPCYKWMTFNTL